MKKVWLIGSGVTEYIKVLESLDNNYNWERRALNKFKSITEEMSK